MIDRPNLLEDTRFEQAVHVMYPAMLAQLMLGARAAVEADPDATIGVQLAPGELVAEARAADLEPVLRLEMQRRQAKAADGRGGGT